MGWNSTPTQLQSSVPLDRSVLFEVFGSFLGPILTLSPMDGTPGPTGAFLGPWGSVAPGHLVRGPPGAHASSSSGPLQIMGVALRAFPHPDLMLSLSLYERFPTTLQFN